MLNYSIVMIATNMKLNIILKYNNLYFSTNLIIKI